MGDPQQGELWITADQIISEHACTLAALVVTPSAAAASLTVYDGLSTSAPHKLDIVISTKDTYVYAPPGGVKMPRGLFVGSLTNVTGVLVTWTVP
jgi:hypothetical protein